MKSPEEYFSIRKEASCTIYEWQEKARFFVTGLIGISLLVVSFVKTFIDRTVPLYIFIITTAVVMAVLIFFWVYDQFRLAIDKDGLSVARGAGVFFGSGPGTRYFKKDFMALYTKSPSNFSNFDFGNDMKSIYLQLNNARTIRLTNGLLDERANFLIDELKVFFIFSNRPIPVNLKIGPKLLLAWAITVLVGVATPRLLEVGEYALEKQSNGMRVAAGVLGMSFIFWILTSTDAILKEGELSSGNKYLLYGACLVPTVLILAYLYVL